MFQLTRFSHNTVFFRNKNARYAGTRCRYLDHQNLKIRCQKSNSCLENFFRTSDSKMNNKILEKLIVYCLKCLGVVTLIIFWYFDFFQDAYEDYQSKAITIGPHFLCWISGVIPFNTWLISSREENKQNDIYFTQNVWTCHFE